MLFQTLNNNCIICTTQITIVHFRGDLKNDLTLV